MSLRVAGFVRARCPQKLEDLSVPLVPARPATRSLGIAGSSFFHRRSPDRERVRAPLRRSCHRGALLRRTRLHTRPQRWHYLTARNNQFLIPSFSSWRDDNAALWENRGRSRTSGTKMLLEINLNLGGRTGRVATQCYDRWPVLRTRRRFFVRLHSRCTLFSAESCAGKPARSHTGFCGRGIHVTFAGF